MQTAQVALQDSLPVLEAVPVGLVVYDASQRLVLANRAYCTMLGLPAGTFRPGSSLADNVRMIAYRGAFGPGDVEAQVAEALRVDPAATRRVRRRQPGGRTFEEHHVPLDDGAHMTCLIDTTTVITMRDEAELAMLRVQTALSSLRIGVALFGGDRRVQFHNRRFTELLGLPAASLQPGLPFADLLQRMQARDEYAGFEGDLFLAGQLALDRGRPASLRRQRAAGQVIEVQSDPLPDGGWTMTVSDVSAQVRAEDEARRRAGILDSIVQHIPHGIAVYGPDRRVTMVNASYHRVMAGAPIAIGDTMENLVRQRALAGEYGPGNPVAFVAQQLGFDTTHLQQRQRSRPNGTQIEVRTAPLPDGGHVSVVTDITALATAQDELQRRAGLMDAMLANIRHGIILWDQDRRIVAYNAMAVGAIDAPPGLVTAGRTLEETVQNELERGNLGSGHEAEAKAQWLLTCDRTVPNVDQRLTQSGRVLEVRSDPTPEGGFVTTYTDVTTIREAETALQASRAMADAANTGKSRFLAAMSHELRTPLLQMIGQSAEIRRMVSGAGMGGPKPAAKDTGAKPAGTSQPGTLQPGTTQAGTRDLSAVVDAAGLVHETGRHLLSMLDTILDVARLEAGRFDLADDLVDVPRLVTACLRQVDMAAAAAEITLSVDLPPDLPLVRGDERRLHHVLKYLVGNAVNAAAAGSAAMIRASRDPSAPDGLGDLLIQVADEQASLSLVPGAGLPSEALDGEGAAEHLPSNGLGLYVSRALMRAHGGDILLGAGPAAVMRLPASRLVPAPSPAQEHAEASHPLHLSR